MLLILGFATLATVRWKAILSRLVHCNRRAVLGLQEILGSKATESTAGVMAGIIDDIICDRDAAYVDALVGSCWASNLMLESGLCCRDLNDGSIACNLVSHAENGDSIPLTSTISGRLSPATQRSIPNWHTITKGKTGLEGGGWGNSNTLENPSWSMSSPSAVLPFLAAFAGAESSSFTTQLSTPVSACMSCSSRRFSFFHSAKANLYFPSCISFVASIDRVFSVCSGLLSGIPLTASKD